MKILSHSPKFLAVGLLTAVLLPSCSLPPSVAWREIQSDGLIPFIKNGMSAPKAQPNALYANQVVTPPSPKVEAAAARTTPMQSAYAVSGLMGYVRTPYTNPPRLVDVRGAGTGDKVVCPYTQRPFIVPAAAVVAAPSASAPAAQVAATQPKAVTPAKNKPTASPAVVRTLPEPAPKVAAAPKPESKPQPTPAPVTKPKAKPVETPQVATTPPAPTKPAPAPAPEKMTTAPPAASPPAAKLPFGAAITGRPGFVNSPYAEKHQLVDVTGLAVGTEVKCPYTGKLFLVPPQQQAKK